MFLTLSISCLSITKEPEVLEAFGSETPCCDVARLPYCIRWTARS